MPNTLIRLPRRILGAAAMAVLLASCAGSGGLLDTPQAGPVVPEGSSGWSAKPHWQAEKFAVATANPLATQAGYQMLKAGGSAIDAAIAAQMVLTLVEPQSSGLGGGALLLHAAGADVTAWDGRETAPAADDEKLFLNEHGRPLAFYDAVIGGRSVGTPGTVPMLEAAHKAYGRLPWAQLFQPAIQLAEQGFAVSPRLNALLQKERYLQKDPVAAHYFYDASGAPWPVGHVLKNPELAETLKAIAQRGSAALSAGPIAQAIVDKVNRHPTNPGKLSLADLAGYRPKQRAPICQDYTPAAAGKTYEVCGFPPPSSGAIAIGQILGLLAQTPAARMPLDAHGLPSADWLYDYAEASRLAFADRGQYVADPDFTPAPAGDWMSLLAPAYLAERARLIGTPELKSGAQPGQPAGAVKTGLAPMPAQVEHGTSHISIVDGYGNALALTTTIEDQFGARQMVKGFLLNNDLTDFSFEPSDVQGHPIVNRVQPGKRPRSSMAPTLVFEKNADGARGPLVMASGSPGGMMIIHYAAKTLYGVLNWGLTPQQAIDLPNFGAVNGPNIMLEAGMFPPATVQQLQARGLEVREMPMTSGLQALMRAQVNGKMLWLGSADPRREGTVMGD
jgi:gamma-glutamyltranspeptidase/glutathione hydrolase